MRSKLKINSVGKVAVLQVAVLVIAIFAFAWMAGSSFGSVSAEDDDACTAEGGTCQNSATCGGTVLDGLCPGGNDNKYCCVPGEEDSLDLDEADDSEYEIEDWMVDAGTWGIDRVTTKPTASTGASEATTGGIGVIERTFPGTGIESLFGESATGIVWKEVAGTIVKGSAWVAVAFLVGRYGGQALGLSVSNAQALGYSLAAGTAAGYFLYQAGVTQIFSEAIGFGAGAGGAGGPIGIVIGVAVSIIVFAIMYKNTASDTIIYNCNLWEAELGGKNCKLCNDQDIPCTEYQCMSLGQSCKYEIDEETGQSLCYWENEYDITAPEISAWDGALIDEDLYEYIPYDQVSSGDKGVELIYGESDNGCAPAWTEISFGVESDERIKCKISPDVVFDDYEDMPPLYFSNGMRLYQHKYALSLPTTEALESENITVENGGVYEMYVRCQDSNGNANPGNFVIKFCIDEGPDEDAPIIRGSSPIDNTPIANSNEFENATIYVNEPSECRWDHQDRSYELMENEMGCATDARSVNSQSVYECKSTLDSLVDNSENTFYFRCEDQPWLGGTEGESQRNVNTQSYELTLISTEDLIITDVGPTGDIFDSTSPVPVELTATTEFGADEGGAICSLSKTGEEGSFIEFYYGSDERYSHYEHSQTIYLGEGEYTYYIRCIDRAGSIAEEDIEFSVEVDEEGPSIIRLFKEDDYLRIMTDEDAQCYYSNFDCNFYQEDGIEFTTPSGDEDVIHYADWDEEGQTTYYIRCKDVYGNGFSDSCTTVRPFDIPDLRN